MDLHFVSLKEPEELELRGHTMLVGVGHTVDHSGPVREEGSDLSGLDKL